MSEHTNKQQGFVFTGTHMLLAMVGFFGVIITVNFTMAMLASGSWTGLVVKNSYVASQKFNDELASAKAQQVAGYRSEFAYEEGRMRFVLKDKSGKALFVSALQAEIGRPAFEQADQVLPFVPETHNAHTLAIDLQPGIWMLKITGTANGTVYRRDVRLHVDANGLGRAE